nr:NADH dehydrogenase subunit 6 [Acharax sp. NY-2022]
MMILIMLSSLISSLAFILPSMTQPLSLGLSIMYISITSCMLIGLEISSWFGYILFLVFIGGLLVMFSYVAALMPNVFFSNMQSLLLFMLSFIEFFLLFLWFWFPMSSKIMNMSMHYIFMQESMTGMIICSNMNMNTLIFLGVILLLTLIAVVKICFNQDAPLRPFIK